MHTLHSFFTQAVYTLYLSWQKCVLYTLPKMTKIYPCTQFYINQCLVCELLCSNRFDYEEVSKLCSKVTISKVAWSEKKTTKIKYKKKQKNTHTRTRTHRERESNFSAVHKQNTSLVIIFWVSNTDISDKVGITENMTRIQITDLQLLTLPSHSP